MVRPAVSEWESVFGFTDDPTPGDAESLQELARNYRSVANDAESALPTVSGLESRQTGEGKTMEALQDKLGDLAKQVRKLNSSYDQAAGALDTYVDHLRDAQRDADHALEKGRTAKERLDQATSAVMAAGASISALDAADPPPPDDQAARDSARKAMEKAQDSKSAAQGDADDAQAALDAARMLAEDARELRETQATVAAQALDDARGEAVEGYSLLEKIGKILGFVLGVISGILGFIAFFIPGLQGLGLVLSIGSFLTGAAALGVNVALSAETGDWDIADLVLSSAGLLLGGAGLLKAFGKGMSLTMGKVPGDLAKLPGTIKSLPTDIVTKVPKVIKEDMSTIWRGMQHVSSSAVSAGRSLNINLTTLKNMATFKSPFAVSQGVVNQLPSTFKNTFGHALGPFKKPDMGAVRAWFNNPAFDIADRYVGFPIGVAGFGYGVDGYIHG